MKVAPLLEASQLYKRELLHLQQELAPFDTHLGLSCFSTKDNPILVLSTTVDNKGFRGTIETSVEREPPVFEFRANWTRHYKLDLQQVDVNPPSMIMLAADAIKSALIQGAVRHLCAGVGAPWPPAHMLAQYAIINDIYEDVGAALTAGKLEVVKVQKHKLAEARRRFQANSTTELSVASDEQHLYLLVRLP